MNRRDFFKKSALALFGFSVLPGALTHERIWKPTRKIVRCATLNPEWVNAPYGIAYFWEPTKMDGIEAAVKVVSPRKSEEIEYMLHGPYPPRFVMETDNSFRTVYPFIEVEREVSVFDRDAVYRVEA